MDKIDAARKELSYCCQTLCDKSVVFKALPRISKEHALSIIDSKSTETETYGVIVPEREMRLLIKLIYG